jgi:hypothetical protein
VLGAIQPEHLAIGAINNQAIEYVRARNLLEKLQLHHVTAAVLGNMQFAWKRYLNFRIGCPLYSYVPFTAAL